MGNRYKLSVIIPNFNNDAYLSQCIDSVLAQTLKDIEIVISDDCSTDGSKDIIATYASKDSRIRPIFNNERLNVSVNRHMAITASVAEYFTTLDSDDFYCNILKLEKELEIIEDHKNNMNRDVCAFSNIIIIDENGSFAGHQWPEEKILQGDVFSGIFSRNCMIPRDYTCSRQLYFMSGGYDPAFNLYEDWDLKIRLARIAPFYFTGIDGVAYRKKGNGLSYVPFEQHAEAIQKIYHKNEGAITPGEKEVIQNGLKGFLQA